MDGKSDERELAEFYRTRGGRGMVSDDHNAEARESAVREIIAEVVRTGGVEGLADLALELSITVARSVKQIAQDQDLPAADVLDLLFCSVISPTRR